MKQFIAISLICSVFAVACHKQAVPVITARTAFPEAPKSTEPLIVENSPEAIAAGKILFETRCNRCHDLRDTKGYVTERWASILKIMVPRARLNEGQAKQVTAYIMANAQK